MQEVISSGDNYSLSMENPRGVQRRLRLFIRNDKADSPIAGVKILTCETVAMGAPKERRVYIDAIPRSSMNDLPASRHQGYSALSDFDFPQLGELGISDLHWTHSRSYDNVDEIRRLLDPAVAQTMDAFVTMVKTTDNIDMTPAQLRDGPSSQPLAGPFIELGKKAASVA